jgi:pyruvate/2-oxoglutarate dehydrogenase complex dihydrolipoamide acyltransferase (E2) component
MPHEVIMPALGMAQDSGVLVRWLKGPGDAVAEGDALFEVETDKAVMEVEAQGAGFLTDVTAKDGEDVPVGQVIAQISESAESSPTPARSNALPEGQTVIMPALGMAQDTGLLVSWLKAPGDAVAADDLLFEVETDKSTMEVPAGHDGFVAALLAEAGEEVPVGEAVGIISATKPDAATCQSRCAAQVPKPAPVTNVPAPTPKPPAKATPTVPVGGPILASPKARRLALERGLILGRLAQAGHPQPYHVKDLEVLAAMPTAGPATGAVATARKLSASIPADGFSAFADWARDHAGLSDVGALITGLAAASLRAADPEIVVAYDAFGVTQHYANPDHPRLGHASPAPADGTPDLRVRDLRFSRITNVDLGAEDAPVLTLLSAGDRLTIKLECSADQLSATAALSLLSDFAGRMEQPLRHLL